MHRMVSIDQQSSGDVSTAEDDTQLSEILGRHLMRPRVLTAWNNIKYNLQENFGLSEQYLQSFDTISAEDALKAYETMQLSRQFEVGGAYCVR